MSTLATTLGVARSNLVEGPKELRKRGRPPLPHDDILAEMHEIIAETPTYGYRFIWAQLRRRRREAGHPWPNHKRVYRIAKVERLLLERHTGAGIERRHDGTIAVERSDRRWCSDEFQIVCDNRERVRVAFSLDCCDREAIRWLGTTDGIAGEHVRDLMIETVEERFGDVPAATRVEWLSDNGSPYVAKDTRKFGREVGLEPCRTPIRSPQSNGMAEAFVKTFKRDYVRVNPCPDARTVLASLPGWFDHYNEHRPHSALKYLSPREFRRAKLSETP